ncbi:hypothetical protein NFI96_016193 [Prochilodus magdalenae]|nr:hypothetical protein NFI96_016193 [Prochilodus magdalenae]
MTVFRPSLGPGVVLILFSLSYLTQSAVSWSSPRNRNDLPPDVQCFCVKDPGLLQEGSPGRLSCSYRLQTEELVILDAMQLLHREGEWTVDTPTSLVHLVDGQSETIAHLLLHSAVLVILLLTIQMTPNSPGGAEVLDSGVLRFRYLERPSQFGGTECVHTQWDEKPCPQGGECELPDDCGEMFTCPETGQCLLSVTHIHTSRTPVKDAHDAALLSTFAAMASSTVGLAVMKRIVRRSKAEKRNASACSPSQELRRARKDLKPYTVTDMLKQRSSTQMPCLTNASVHFSSYSALGDVFVNPVLDHKYFGGVCEYIYNGEWRQLTYDSFCENLHYNNAEMYFRKPHNFLSYRLLAHSTGEESSEYYSDAVSLLKARKTEESSKPGFSLGVMYVENGYSWSKEKSFLTNISQYDSKDVGFVRIKSKVETAHFKMRTRDLMLDEDMLQTLMELPESYDFGSYSRFLNEFGTHYVTQGVMGGVLEYVLVVNKDVMRRSQMEGSQVGKCFTTSLGIKASTSFPTEVKVTGEHSNCETVGEYSSGKDGKDAMIQDVIGFVKGGITDLSAAQLAIRNADTYRKWGKSLKYNPAVIDYEVLPIYELVRFSTVADQVGSRLPLLKQAWEEYIQQFNPCRCAPCRNNGIPVLSGTACKCICGNGYSGMACERSQRKGPTHGSWSCWGDWTPCLSGTRTRRRVCNNPPPKDDGLPCQGSSVQRRSC